MQKKLNKHLKLDTMFIMNTQDNVLAYGSGITNIQCRVRRNTSGLALSSVKI